MLARDGQCGARQFDNAPVECFWPILIKPDWRQSCQPLVKHCSSHT